MDSAGKLISENNVPEIFGGSVLKLAGTLYPTTPAAPKASVCNWRRSNRHACRSCRNFAFEAEEDGYIDAATIITPANDNNAGEAADNETTREAYDF